MDEGACGHLGFARQRSAWFAYVPPIPCCSRGGGGAQVDWMTRQQVDRASRSSGPNPSVIVALAVLAAAIVYRLLWLQGEAAVERSPGELVPEPASVVFSPVDEAGRIYYAPEFLSQGEIDYLLQLVNISGGWAASPTGGPNFKTPTRRDGPEGFEGRVSARRVAHCSASLLADSLPAPHGCASLPFLRLGPTPSWLGSSAASRSTPASQCTRTRTC